MKFYRGVFHLWAAWAELYTHQKQTYVYNYETGEWKVVSRGTGISFQEYNLTYQELSREDQEIVLSWDVYLQYQLGE